jgi:tetratricopeptide (TPR) repeat protein
MNSTMSTAARNGSGLDFFMLKWRARAFLFLGLQEHALETFQDMLARWPEDGYVLQSLANIEAARGHLHRAVLHLRRLVALMPSSGAAWFNLAYVLEQQALAQEAEQAFRKAIELEPSIDRAWYGLGLTLIRQQRYEEAIDALKRNTEMQPMSPYGWYQMARAHMDLGHRDEAARVIRHLEGFEPKVAAQLKRETGIGSSKEVGTR